MSTEYRIEPIGDIFIVVDRWGGIVDRYPTKEAARQDIERCKRDDGMRETAKLLIDRAVNIHMELHGIDRATALYWVCSAAEAAD